MIPVLAGAILCTLATHWYRRAVHGGDVEAGHRADGLGAVAGFLLAAGFALAGWWALAIPSAVLAVWCVWDWWRRRRKRDRVRKLLSERGRAVIAALVKRVREVSRPRPVLSPVPGGAR